MKVYFEDSDKFSVEAETPFEESYLIGFMLAHKIKIERYTSSSITFKIVKQKKKEGGKE